MGDSPEVVYVDEAYGTPLIQAYQLPLPEQQPRSASSQALVASFVAVSGAARLYGFSGDNSKTSAQFILVFDTATAPVTGAVPNIVVRVPASTTFSAYWGSAGRWFDRGIVLANSSTEATLTPGSADCWFDVQYTPQVI